MPNLLLYGKKMKKLCRFWYDSKKNVYLQLLRHVVSWRNGAVN